MDAPPECNVLSRDRDDMVLIEACLQACEAYEATTSSEPTTSVQPAHSYKKPTLPTTLAGPAGTETINADTAPTLALSTNAGGGSDNGPATTHAFSTQPQFKLEGGGKGRGKSNITSTFARPLPSFFGGNGHAARGDDAAALAQVGGATKKARIGGSHILASAAANRIQKLEARQAAAAAAAAAAAERGVTADAADAGVHVASNAAEASLGSYVAPTSQKKRKRKRNNKKAAQLMRGGSGRPNTTAKGKKASTLIGKSGLSVRLCIVQQEFRIGLANSPSHPPFIPIPILTLTLTLAVLALRCFLPCFHAIARCFTARRRVQKSRRRQRTSNPCRSTRSMETLLWLTR